MADTDPIGFGGEVVPGMDISDKTPRLKSLDEYAGLAEGTEFIDPKGQRKQKPYNPKTPDEAAVLPEGAWYRTPDGQLKQQPKYEGLDFTTQTLYNMAATQSERKKALERGYPGKVKTNPITGENYVEDNGKFRRSKGVLDAPGAFAASQAAPVLGAIGGEITGAAAGSVVPGAGTFAGAVGGGAVGGALGQGFNDIVMELAGVYDRTGREEAAELGTSAAFGGVGTAAGRYIAAAAPLIKTAAAKILPKFASDILGADPEALEQAIALRKKGVMVPISTWAKEAPHLINLSEVLDPAMRTQKPLLESATGHYESEAGRILDVLGVPKSAGKISEPTAAVSSEEAGDRVLGRMRQEMAQADARVKADFENARTLLEKNRNLQSAAWKAQVRQLENTQAEATAKAEKVLKRGFAYVKRSADKAMEATNAGRNSGDLWRAVGEKVRAYRAAIAARATDMYNLADELSGGIQPEVSGLSDSAKAFLDEMPESFKAQYPSVVQKISDWAGETNDLNEVVREPVRPTWAQLHNLRSVLRQNYSRLDLTPDVKHGSFKFFANKVDKIISDEAGDPQLAAAAKQLKAADNFYRDNMGPLGDTRIQAVMNGLEAGMPADPKLLYTAIVKEGRTELTQKIKEIVGKNLWSGVAAADKQEMLAQAKTLVPGQIDARRFAQQVLERDRDGMLELVHGKRTADQLRRKAQNIGLLEGKLDLDVRPADSMTDTLERAQIAANDAKLLAEKDPLGSLQHELSEINKAERAAQSAASQKRAEEPLGFAYDLKVGGRTAADRILDHEDLIVAAAHKFGDQSPEFNALRQVWAQRLLMGTIDPGSRLEKVSEQIQRLMFPGVTLDQMKLLAKEMTFLLSSRHAGQGTGKSIMATSVVEHPWGPHMPIDTGHSAMRKIIGGNFVGRAILTKYFAFITEMTNKPWLMQLVQKGLEGPDPQAVAQARKFIAQRMKLGGAIGAAAGESQFQTPNQETFFQ